MDDDAIVKIRFTKIFRIENKRKKIDLVVAPILKIESK
jgi:hypothetical protein